jgi:hypothetical protein
MSRLSLLPVRQDLHDFFSYCEGLLGFTSRARETDNISISSLLLLTDENGHRWEIRIPADDSVEHRRVGRTGWVTGWPASLPSSRDVESLFDSAMLVLKNPDSP